MLVGQVSTKKLIRDMGSNDLVTFYQTLNEINDVDHKLRDLCIKCYKELTGNNLLDEF